jgi:AcrR family transcriptional regulator
MPKVVPEYKEKAKERILGAAMEVFSQKGFHDSRMEDIAAKVGVSKRTLYLYYENKEELFRALCAGAPKQMAEMLQACFKDDPEGLACTKFFDLATSGPPSGFDFEIISAASRNPTLKKIEGDLQQEEIKVIADILEDRKRKGVLPSDVDAQQTARVLIALYRGLNADLVLGAKKSDVRQAWIDATAKIMASSPGKRSKD